ncbi:hypothetical protein JL721_8542 [Aureococcus anophagefferens]|nr:hypothetical protein JL721_8542 [Aureococcus anophagefferens]
MDGVDQWDALRGLAPPRDEVLLGVDDADGRRRHGRDPAGKWKLLVNVRREPVYDGCSEAGVRYLDDEPRSFLRRRGRPGESGRTTEAPCAPAILELAYMTLQTTEAPCAAAI